MFTYIDLFCGIGGFHQGIDRVAKKNRFEARCIFAADNDEAVSKIYQYNYGIDCFYDLKKESTHNLIDCSIGKNELTCIFAGFPCQPFSKAGNQEGFQNQMKGTLFFEIEKIIHRHRPKYILLENVRNLKSHDGGNTWDVIKKTLEAEGYYVDSTILSPNQIGPIPALRERFFILAYNKEKLGLSEENLSQINIKCDKKHLKTSIYNWNRLERGLKRKYFIQNLPPDIDEEKSAIIDMWNDFYHRMRDNNRKLISPIWPKFFSTNVDLTNVPEWKQKLIKKNQNFYKNNSDIYDQWYMDYKEFFDSISASSQKFEWNAGTEINDIWEGIIQFRPSGVRVKKPDFIPTLVAINQTPIIGSERRYLNSKEMAKLYGFKRLNLLEQSEAESCKQLGNTVSVDVVEFLINHMLTCTNYCR